MTTITPDSDIESFKSAVSPVKQRRELDLALQSFAKRNRYVEIYYDDFVAASKNFPIEGIDSSGAIRERTEAYAVAFIANVHAMIDSFPYVIYLVLEPLSFKDKKDKLKNITEDNAGWSESFLSSLLYTNQEFNEFASLFSAFLEDKDFKLLKDISNKHKHKFLLRIKNNAGKPCFEINDLFSEKETNDEVDVKTFLTDVHDKLLPKIFNLYHELQVCARKKKLGD